RREEREEAVKAEKLAEENRRQERELVEQRRREEKEEALKAEKEAVKAEKLAEENRHKEFILMLSKQNASILRAAEETREKQERDRDMLRQSEGTMEARLDKAYMKLKPFLYDMPKNNGDLTLYLNNVEKLFHTYRIDDDLRVPLLTPHLTEFARKVLLRLPEEHMTSYTQWKAALLKEHRLTPSTYRSNYMNAIRTRDESAVQFATRLTCLLQYYLDSRNVNGSYDRLVKLLLRDRMKDTLSNYERFHVTDKENGKWMDIHEIADIVDIYESERGRDFSRAGFPGQQKGGSWGSQWSLSNQSLMGKGDTSAGKSESKEGYGN
ncbi:MAG: hypothetical protein MN733_30640, partial [Nitrososphaera sp.]|nr:hypothetical protein [Nitrososphaera sp.]